MRAETFAVHCVVYRRCWHRSRAKLLRAVAQIQGLVGEGAHFAKGESDWLDLANEVNEAVDRPLEIQLLQRPRTFCAPLAGKQQHPLGSTYSFRCRPLDCAVGPQVQSVGLGAAASLESHLEASRRAEALSEALLRAVTLVPDELEFPLEHLMAVYLPMWMPLAMPLLLGLAKPPLPAHG